MQIFACIIVEVKSSHVRKIEIDLIWFDGSFWAVFNCLSIVSIFDEYELDKTRFIFIARQEFL